MRCDELGCWVGVEVLKGFCGSCRSAGEDGLDLETSVNVLFNEGVSALRGAIVVPDMDCDCGETQ